MWFLLVRLKVILAHKYLAFPKLLDPRVFYSLRRVTERVWVQLRSDQLSIKHLKRDQIW